jgi:hypothetical protein
VAPSAFRMGLYQGSDGEREEFTPFCLYETEYESNNQRIYRNAITALNVYTVQTIDWKNNSSTNIQKEHSMKTTSSRLIIFAIATGIFVGCATTSILSIILSQEEKDYLAKANDQPLTFCIPKGEEKEAWSRAQQFVSKYSSGPIAVVTDVVIQSQTSYDYSYTVNKSAKGDSVEISVLGGCLNVFNKADAAQNCHILAYYIKTDILPPKDRLVQR